MAAHKGDKDKIKKDGVVICTGINQKDLKINSELIDDTANSNRGFSVSLDAVDTKSVTIDFKGIAKSRFLRKLRLTDQNILKAVTYEFANGDTIAGDFIMADYSHGGGFKDAIQFSCSLRSNGPYTFTFSETENDGGGAGGGGGGGGDGDFKMFAISRLAIGETYSCTEGDLKGLCFTFDFDFPTKVDRVYQPRRIMNGAAEMSSMALNAIDGSYAICCESTGITPPRYAAIVPFYTDAEIKVVEDWEGLPVVAGTDFALIDCGEDFAPQSIIMVAAKKFIIQVSSHDLAELQFWDIICVDYTTPMAVTKTAIRIELSDYDLAGYYFVPNSQSTAISREDPTRACCLLRAYNGESSQYIKVIFNPSTGVIISESLIAGGPFGIYAGIQSPLQGLVSFGENALSFFNAATGEYGSRANASHGGIKMGNFAIPPTSVIYYTYTSRYLDSGVEQFTDAVEHDPEGGISSFIPDKLATLGFTGGSFIWWPNGSVFVG